VSPEAETRRPLHDPVSPELKDARDLEAVRDISRARDRIRREIAKVIVGQDEVVDQLLVALFANGHSLFVGVPGLAKTLLVQTLASSLDLSFRRIQFTPDLMPSDITGTEVLEEDRATGRRSFKFIRGPLFANLLLADEINRTPPKTQAALLQAMQERKVTAGGVTHPLDPPFLVCATQNPIEQEGTYPLPEAQLDRFMFQVRIDYPDEAEEVAIVRATTSGAEAVVEKVLAPERILELQELVRRVPAPEHAVSYAVRLTRASRPSPQAPEFVRSWVRWGAGPRASQHLVLAAKARAVLHGRYAASVEDVRALAQPVLEHRLITNFHAEAEGIASRDVVERLKREVAE
jgi:MoxR-like ATPase